VALILKPWYDLLVGLQVGEARNYYSQNISEDYLAKKNGKKKIILNIIKFLLDVDQMDQKILFWSLTCMYKTSY
jgi:hypothetical protein